MNAPTTRETAGHLTGERDMVTADHAELAACPFCGSEPRYDIGKVEFIDAEACCENCGAAGPNFNTADRAEDNLSAAIAAWNERPREAALLSEIAALRGALAEAERDASSWSRCAGEVVTIGESWKERFVKAERQRDEARDTIASTVAKADWMQGHLSGERSSIDRETIELVVSECRAYCHLQALANQGADHA